MEMQAGKWTNEKHTLAGTVLTREFNYLVSRTWGILFGIGVSPPLQLTKVAAVFSFALTPKTKG